MIFLTLAWRSLQRNPYRTWLTGSMIALGTSLLIIGVSWIFGIQGSVISTMITDSGEIRITTTAFYQKEQQLPIAENIVNTEVITELLQKEPQVDFIYTRLRQQVLWTKKQDEEIDTENIAVFIGISPLYYTEQLKIGQKFLSGRFFEKKHEIIAGATLATDHSLQINDSLYLFGQTQDGSLSPMKMTIVGICDFGNPIQNANLFGSLRDAQWMADIPNGGTEVLIYSEYSGQEVAQHIREKYPSLPTQSQTLDRDGNPLPFSILSWDQREPFRSILPILFFFDIFLVSSIILVTALGILNTMIMSILERQKELGILQAIGLSKKHIAILVFAETLILTGIGGSIGCILGSCIALGMEGYGVPLGDALANSGNVIANNIVHPDWRIEISLLGLFLSVLMGILGTIFPLIHLFRVSIVDLLRNN